MERRVDIIYEKINSLNNELKEIREDCPHLETYDVDNYQWRVASSIPATLCKECDEVITITRMDYKDE